MDVFDLAIAWEWEYDRDFVSKLDAECQKKGCRNYLISHYNRQETLEKLTNNQIRFKVFLDRATDTNHLFMPIANAIQGMKDTWFINNPIFVQRAIDKATMHLEFLNKGINVPYTLTLSPLDEDAEPRYYELAPIGTPFIIKPAHGGGSEGVITDAQSHITIYEARKGNRHDKYLIQQKVTPVVIEQKKAWFRVFYVLGDIITCWWDNEVFTYQKVTSIEEERYNLSELRRITKVINEICKLDFFSTEICFTSENKFIVVDYVNDQCDMRLKSGTPDGVPDDIVDKIVSSIISGIHNKLN